MSIRAAFRPDAGDPWYPVWQMIMHSRACGGASMADDGPVSPVFIPTVSVEVKETAEVDRNLGDTQTKQAGKRKTAASARVTETAVSSPPNSVVDESSIAQAAPVNGNAVAQPMLARRVVLVGGTTEFTPPSAKKTTSKVFCVHPAPVTINRKRLEA